jgi:hypothetical protein
MMTVPARERFEHSTMASCKKLSFDMELKSRISENVCKIISIWIFPVQDLLSATVRFSASRLFSASNSN